MFLTESDFQFGKLCQNTSRKPIDVNTADVINYDLHCFFFGWGWWLDFESIDVNSKQIFQLYGALFFGNSDVIRTLRIFLGDSSVDFLSPFGKNGLVKRWNRCFFSLSLSRVVQMVLGPYLSIFRSQWLLALPLIELNCEEANSFDVIHDEFNWNFTYDALPGLSVFLCIHFDHMSID